MLQKEPVQKLGKRCTICTIDYSPIQPDESSTKQPLVLIIGRDPGAEEVRLSKIFIGRSGRLLRSDLESAGYKKSDFILDNLVKCHTPNNRGPNLFEIECCSGILRDEITKFKPKIILCLGNEASGSILKQPVQITKDRGFYSLVNKPYDAVCTFHPSFVLRDQNQREQFREDLLLALEKAREQQFVYMLRCQKNNALYVGVTNNLPRRLGEHNSGTGGRYTRAFGPVKLVYFEFIYGRGPAVRRERALKQAGKAAKEELVRRMKPQLLEPYL